MRVGLMTEYPSPSVQSGPALHTRFLYEGLLARGHEVALMGPDTRSEASLPPCESQLYPAFSYPTHPKVKIAMPPRLDMLRRPPRVDIIHSQTNTHMAHYAMWMREMWKIPVLNTHTIHLPSHSHFIMSDALWANDWVKSTLHKQARRLEGNFANLYNRGDALIVQSRHLVDYWRERGVTVPIETVGRPIDPSKFSRQPGPDPFPNDFIVGKRLLVVCRHDREKSLDHLIDLFARHLAPSDPEITLTLVGDGHDHMNLVNRAMATPYASRIYFPGEARHNTLVDWYAHGDVFVYTSVSETFGNVINEALWCGLPVVALDDKMGVSHQMAPDVNGFLVTPDRGDTDTRFADACLRLCRSQDMRRLMGEQAANLSRCTSDPSVVLGRFEHIYAEARARAQRLIIEPLSEKSRGAQTRSLIYHTSRWAFWNGMLLAIAHTATRIGASRRGTASQHQAIVNHLVHPAVSAPTQEQHPVQEHRPAA